MVLDARSLVVKPEAARRQLDAEAAERPEPAYTPAGVTAGPGIADGGGRGPTAYAPPGATPVAAPPKPRRFHGSVELDATRLTRDAANIADAVVQHLAALVNARVRVTLEIDADIPDGAPDAVVRTVTENCRTLRFTTSGFEET